MVTFEANSAPGTAVLPAARVRRIVKEDKDIYACGSDSLYLITRATEYFVDSLVRESYEFSRLDKRKTVQYKDMAKAVQSIEQYDFLMDIIPPTVAVAATKKPSADKQQQQPAQNE
ncbi:hypothetical protein GGF46_001602 [Coemansia sp. RSA 552]|nr:hypothetical protein GGF46_001602 [Coemansia sp. RSA 552]